VAFCCLLVCHVPQRIKTKIQKYLQQFITRCFFCTFWHFLLSLNKFAASSLHAPRTTHPPLLSFPPLTTHTHKSLPSDIVVVVVFGLFWSSLCSISISLALYLCQLAISQLHLKHSFSVIQRGASKNTHTDKQTRRHIKRMRHSRII